MRNLIRVEFRKMRCYWMTWGVGLFFIAHSVYMALRGTYVSSLNRYPSIEYVLCLYSTARMLSIVTILLTAYVIAEDFSMRTVQNVLAAGISRGKYYFSRLCAQMIFIFSLYSAGYGAYIVTRILSTGKVNTQMPAAEFLTVFFVMALQPLAYVAVTAMISVFCKSQSASVVAAEAWLFFSIVLRLYSIKEIPGGTAAVVYKGPIAYEPLTVLERFLEDFVLPGRVLTFDFFLCAVSAALIITVSSAVGYMHLQRSDIR